jgi:hypothetical protein
MTSPRDIVHFVLNFKGKEGATVTCLLCTWWDARNKDNAKEGMLVIEEVQHKTMEAALNSSLLR